MKRHIDGTMPDDTLQSGDGVAPFWAFDEDAQDLAGGPFSRKVECEAFILGATEYSEASGRTWDDDQDLNEAYDKGRNYAEKLKAAAYADELARSKSARWDAAAR